MDAFHVPNPMQGAVRDSEDPAQQLKWVVRRYMRQHPSTKEFVLGHKARRIEDYEVLDQQHLADEVARLRAELKVRDNTVSDSTPYYYFVFDEYLLVLNSSCVLSITLIPLKWPTRRAC
jgi:hypothetical protein